MLHVKWKLMTSTIIVERVVVVAIVVAVVVNARPMAKRIRSRWRVEV